MTTVIEVLEPVTSVIEITETELVVQTVETVQIVELGIAGPQGVPGATGPQGPAGTSGGTYEHVQAVPASVWSVAHNLGYRPNVFVEDTVGRDVEGELAHIDANNLTLTFSSAFSGAAYLS